MRFPVGERTTDDGWAQTSERSRMWSKGRRDGMMDGRDADG